MLEMLAEVVCAVELLAGVAFPELVHVLKMPDAVLPILFADSGAALVLAAPGKLLAAIPAKVSLAGPCRAVVKCPLVAS